jgi:Rps23 Pro-64 3,4-dihydroxylase Tpa1-like proline 4-hydroxylase
MIGFVPQAAGQIAAIMTEASSRPIKRSDAPIRLSLFEEFLSPDEHAALLAFALANEQSFLASRVITRSGVSRQNYGHRRSTVLFNLGQFERIIVGRLRDAFPAIAGSLHEAPFPITRIEAQLTASNDGEFFHTHRDNNADPVSRRTITFVLFMFAEPQRFSGGMLRLSGTHLNGVEHCIEIAPAQNMAVFFPSYLEHEVTIVRCPSRSFRDSRFTLNGWIHR